MNNIRRVGIYSFDELVRLVETKTMQNKITHKQFQVVNKTHDIFMGVRLFRKISNLHEHTGWCKGGHDLRIMCEIFRFVLSL